MKGEDTAMLLGMIGMKRDHFVPDRDIILALTADEETGAADGIQWLLQTRRPTIAAAYVINPDEGAAGMRHGRRVYYGIQTSTKRYVTYRISSSAPGGHTAAPAQRNAVFVLAAALDRLSGYHFTIRLTDTTRAYFTALAARTDGQEAKDLRSILAAPLDQAAAERIARDPERGAALRSTCTPTMLHTSSAENVLAESAEATLQCRLLPGDEPDTVQQLLRDRIGDPTVAIAITEPGLPAPPLPLDKAVIARIARTAQPPGRDCW